MRTLLWFLLCFSAFNMVSGYSARADILFFDLNLSINELATAQQAAQARGERLFVYPHRNADEQKKLETQWRLTQNLTQKLAKCIEKGNVNCQAISQAFDDANAKMRSMVEKFSRLTATNLPEIFTQLRKDRANLSTIVFSGHSGGSSFSGIFGSLAADETAAAFADFPDLLRPVKSILLWGCYSGTLNSFFNVWKKKFPEVSIFAGFQARSPLGIRESGALFLKSFMLRESDLRKASGIKETHRVFRSIDRVRRGTIDLNFHEIFIAQSVLHRDFVDNWPPAVCGAG